MQDQGETRYQAISRLQAKLTDAYWQLVQKMVVNGRNDRDMSREECQAWVQTGLALTPFCSHVMESSLEWAVAWSLIGEWTSRELFPPPKGAWPRNCHPAKFFSPYDRRSVPLHTWARACFEHGSLPSLPGKAVMLVLPGDKMFQSQYVTSGKSRPVILHGYGGAKKAMKAGLTSIAKQGSEAEPPLWANHDWRPILGTAVDVRTRPEPLSNREEQLLLGCDKTRTARVGDKVLQVAKTSCGIV